MMTKRSGQKNKRIVFLLDTKGQDVIMCRCHGLHVHTIKNTDTHVTTRLHGSVCSLLISFMTLNRSKTQVILF